VRVVPTAQALPADAAATPERTPPVAGVGLGTRFQEVPFQRTIRVLLLVPLSVEPTAQAFRAEVAATPARLPLIVKDAAGPDDLAAAVAADTGATPATTPASSTAETMSLTERVTSTGVRTELPPPSQTARQAHPVRDRWTACWHQVTAARGAGDRKHR
jgi:hypothetical protein